MTSTGITYQAGLEERHGPPLARFAGVATWVARTLAKEIRIRRDPRALMPMSDHLLKDIGLTRGQIERAIR